MNVNVPAPASTSLFATGFQGEVRRIDGRFDERQFHEVLIQGVELKASDLMFISGEPVWAEVAGRNVKLTNRTLTNPEALDLVRIVYNDSGTAELKRGYDLAPSYEIRVPMRGLVRFRVNMTSGRIPGDSGVHITMRTLPGTPLPLAQLHIEKDIIDNYRPGNGLILVTGPTGSGKSTLQSSIIRDIVEKPDANERVYEFAAPIEYVYDDVVMPSSFVFQTEMRTHLRPRQGDADEHSIFAHAVRGALRRHPTIIMVGEARDKATIEATVTAALTGHLVYTTIHTIGVPETIARMLSEFPHGERKARAIDIMNVLRMVVTQILVPRVEGGKVSLREYMIFDAETRAAFLRRDPDEWPGIARTFMRDRLAVSRTMGRHGLERLEAGEISQETYEFVTAREAYV